MEVWGRQWRQLPPRLACLVAVPRICLAASTKPGGENRRQRRGKRAETVKNKVNGHKVSARRLSPAAGVQSGGVPQKKHTADFQYILHADSEYKLCCKSECSRARLMFD